LSLRSRRGYDIAAVARVFGGGGHENAAGATFEEPIQTVVEKVISEAKKCLGSC
ncbi:DHH family phosphoesterase, partial [Enterococcus faecium]|uniref:DHH family phosphoesterase n=1 Tax=Enterococcus faecium TaxID=1352 RepID=UPI0039080D6F